MRGFISVFKAMTVVVLSINGRRYQIQFSHTDSTTFEPPNILELHIIQSFPDQTIDFWQTEPNKVKKISGHFLVRSVLLSNSRLLLSVFWCLYDSMETPQMSRDFLTKIIRHNYKIIITESA